MFTTKYESIFEEVGDSTLVIIRGIPGSGKSTLADKKYPGFKKIEADMYPGIYDEQGKFNSKLIGQAHIWCQEQARKALSAGKDVVVSNTSLQLWEMKPYILMAREIGLPWKNIIIEEAKYPGKNIHGVPDDKLEMMKKNYQPITKPLSEINWESIKAPWEK